MRKRPIEIKIIALIYMMLPFFYYLQVVYFEKVALFPVGRVLSLYKIEDLILTLSSILVSIAIYRVRTWGWYLFLTHSLGIILWNVYVEYKRENHPNYELIVFSLATLFVIGLFLRKHIKSPYFNPSMRWWEQEKRHALSFAVKLFEENSKVPIEGKTFDVSASGIFFDGDMKNTLGKKYKVCFSEEDDLRDLSLLGEVVWVTDASGSRPAGAGIRFLQMTWNKKRTLRKGLKAIETEI